jgi:group II intron reverse transcriptase/maturase
MAKKHAGSPLTTLSHHLDQLWLREAYGRVRRDSAPGVDGQTVAGYGENLAANLTSLEARAKDGTYRAPPAKRVHLPKNETETRPIGMPTGEDKVLERAVAMLLEPVYEQEFLDCSYGFRPGRSPHQALEALRTTIMQMRGGWVLDVDVRKYFDTIPHQQLREVLRRRIRDGVIDRLIGKWLKAGIWEAGQVSYPEAGTPQGSVISPLLSNVYLHEVLDRWFEQTIKPELHGRAELIRFADDFVVVCEKREDAEALLEQVKARFESYGLTIHPDKTRIVDFRHPWESDDKPQSFDFLGFTHYWEKTRRGG